MKILFFFLFLVINGMEIVNENDAVKNNRKLTGSSSPSLTGNDKDPNVPQTYPFLGISYKISNAPYAPVTLVPYVEPENAPEGITVKSNLVIADDSSPSPPII